MAMNGRCTYYLALLALLASLSACEKVKGSGSGESASIQLALSIGSSSASLTKGNPAVITEMADGSDDQRFRGLTSVIALPLGAEGDESLASPSYLDDIGNDFYDQAVISGGVYVSGIVANNHAHLYPQGKVYFPNGTARVLVYGHAPIYDVGDEMQTQHLNGALTASGLGVQAELRRANDIHFDPVPILSGNLPTKALTLANVLNAIINPEIKYETSFWYDDSEGQHEVPIKLIWNEEVEDNTLLECFREITNDGQLMPGSGRSVEYMIARLYRRLKTYVIYNTTQIEYTHAGSTHPARKQNGDPFTFGDLYRGLQGAIIKRIDDWNGELLTITENTVQLKNSELLGYPSDLGLPDGAAILRWNGTQFYPVKDESDDSTEGVAPINSYCYPPLLWYFSDSSLSLSNSDKSSVFTKEKTNWSEILAEYRFGKVVSPSTHSAALDQPLQFGCGMLVATVATTDTDLPDSEGSTVHLAENCFPITGILVGSQRQLNFDFTPAGGPDFFLYDNCISGVYLPASSQAPACFRTLVSQTPANQDVYLCIEMRNDSGQPFVGADGIVLPGNKFYLVGCIEAPNPQISSFMCVFQRDHKTTIHCTISSLAKARNAIPNLENPHIALGIKISADWVMSTPSHVVLS